MCTPNEIYALFPRLTKRPAGSIPRDPVHSHSLLFSPSEVRGSTTMANSS
jgi:hypothetical protein